MFKAPAATRSYAPGPGRSASRDSGGMAPARLRLEPQGHAAFLTTLRLGPSGRAAGLSIRRVCAVSGM